MEAPGCAEQLPAGRARLLQGADAPSALEFFLSSYAGVGKQSRILTVFGNRVEVEESREGHSRGKEGVPLTAVPHEGPGGV